MDDKKIVKNFIDDLCEWVNKEYTNNECDGFVYNIDGHNRLSYIIADKGIAKRIEIKLFKMFNLRSEIIFRQKGSIHQYLDSEIIIKLKIKKNFLIFDSLFETMT